MAQPRDLSDPRPPSLGYYYFESPDGKECFKKIWFTTKWSTVAGLVTSFYDVVGISHPVGTYRTVARVAFWTGPFAAMGATYGAVTCAATNFRGKDDVLNHMIGGACGGSVWGAIRGKIGVGIGWTAVATFCAVVFKMGADSDWKYFGSKHRAKVHGSYNHYKYDFSLREDPGKRSYK